MNTNESKALGNVKTRQFWIEDDYYSRPHTFVELDHVTAALESQPVSIHEHQCGWNAGHDCDCGAHVRPGKHSPVTSPVVEVTGRVDDGSWKGFNISASNLCRPPVQSPVVSMSSVEFLEGHPLPWSVKAKSYPLDDTGDYTCVVRVLDANGKDVEYGDGDGEAEDALTLMVNATNAHLLATTKQAPDVGAVVEDGIEMALKLLDNRPDLAKTYLTTSLATLKNGGKP